MRIFAWAMLMFSLAAFSAVAEGAQYTCPMHTHYSSEKAGNCPICGMDLVPVETEDEQMSTTPQQQKILYWRAPMDANFTSDKPGKSPMGMDLVPVYADAENTGSSIKISPETIQNIGVRTAKVKMSNFGKNIRSYGLVTENVRLKKEVSSRIAGWVEDLKITAVGDSVKEDDLLFTLYSPELVSAQQDYLSAVSTGSKERISSTAKRLESLGVQQKVIKQLKKKRKKMQNVPFYAEANGIISELMVNQGSYIKSGMHIATVQSYERVWINVSVAEKDLQFLAQGNKASVVLPNLGGVAHTANIDYIYPTLDATSRTGQVRLVLANADGALKPGAYADVTFETQVESRLAVPSEAILKSSEGDFIVVALGKGRFQSQLVTTGISSNGQTEILSGLNMGDNIVVSSQFLIDSESSLKESFRKLKAPKTDASVSGGAHANH